MPEDRRPFPVSTGRLLTHPTSHALIFIHVRRSRPVQYFSTLCLHVLTLS
uniref:Uncharacterized protein n=1 Tax=Anguilla anguilla TaxID=7936 RepID=A0A0E9T3V5_ANGAN